MADKVRVTGVALEIQGAKEFDANLKKAAQNIKQTSAELKRSQSQYKLNENSVTSLADKQSALTKALEAQKSKTPELNKILEAAKEKYGEESKQVSAVATEIAKSETYEADLEQQMKETQKAVEDQSHSLKKYVTELTTAGKGVEGFGDKLSGVGKKLTVGVTVPVAGIATAAVAAFNEVDDGYDVIINKTGATGKVLEQMQDVAKNVYTSMPVEMSDVGAAVGELNTRLDIQGEALESATKQTLQFARVNNVDAESAIQKVTRYMGDASIEASKYGSVLDDLTVAGQKTGISVDTLAEYLTKYGAPLRALGFETKESIALFSQWEKSGVNVEIAFSGMKKAISKWASDGKDSREEFKKTLAEIKACPDIAAATTKAIEVFGAKAGPDLADAIQGGRFAYEDLLSVIESSEGTLSGTYDSLLDGVDSANVALNNAKITLSNLGDTILTSAAPMIEDFTECIKNLGEWYSSLDSGTQKAIVKTGAFFALLGPGMSLLGKTISTGSKVVKGVGKLVTWLGKLKKSSGDVTSGAATMTGALGKTAGATEGAAAGTTALSGAATTATVSVGAMAAALAAVAAVAAVVAIAVNKAKERQEELNGVADAFGEKMDEYNNKLEAATGILSNYNGQLLVSSETLSKIDNGIESTQQKIIKIGENAALESRTITDKEYEEISRLIGLIDSYASKKLEAYNTQQDIIATMASRETNMTSEKATEYTASAKKTYEESLAIAQLAKETAYSTAQANLETATKLAESGEITSAELLEAQQRYNEALDAADSDYSKYVGQANDKYGETMAAITDAYNAQGFASDQIVEQMETATAVVEGSEKLGAGLESLMGRMQGISPVADLLGIGANHVIKAKGIDTAIENLKSAFEGAEGEATAAWLNMIATTELYGGELSEETQNKVDDVLSAFNNLPEDAKEPFKNLMVGALEGLKEKEPELYEEATTSGNGVLKAMREAFDEHSPSKETKKIYKYAMDGAIEGLKDKEKALYKKADEIAANTAKRLKKGLEVNSPSRVVRRIFWSVGEGGILGLKDKEKELYTTSARLASGVAKNLNIQRPAFNVSFGSIAAAQARANRIASSINNTTNYTTSTDYSQHDYGIHVDRVVVNGSESDAYRWLEQVEYQRQLQARARGAR